MTCVVPRHRVALLASAIAYSVATAHPALAQSTSDNPGPGPTIPFVDKSGGYEMRLPAGWYYDRTGFFGPSNATGLLRGVGPDRRTTCQVLLFEKNKSRTFPEWFEYFCKQIGSVDGVESVRAKGLGESPRPSGYVRVDARDGANQIETHYACQAFDERTIWVFSVSSAQPRDPNAIRPAVANASNDEVVIPPHLQAIISSVRVFYTAERATATAAALKRGTEYLARLSLQGDIRKLRIDEHVRYYELLLGGRSIGYLTRQFIRERRGLDDPGFGKEGREGLRIREQSWRFADDQSVRFTDISMFSSVDAESDMFESNETVIPPAGAADARLVTFRDQCVREGEVLFATYFSSVDADRPDPRRPLKIEKSYLGLGWARVLPALLGREPADATAFTIYDAETRALITHTVRPLGEKPVPQTDSAPAYLYETSEGMVETPTRIWTDRHGHMLRVEAGDLIVKLSDKPAIDRTYGERRAAAEKRLSPVHSQPAKPPSR